MRKFICTWCRKPEECKCSFYDDGKLRAGDLECPNRELIAHWVEVDDAGEPK